MSAENRAACLTRILVVVGLVLLFSISASAYTLVMLDGRRIEVPQHFQLSKTTLTYQVSSGIQLTLQLRSIDVAATERLNGESAGDFYKHALPITQEQATTAMGKASRTLTNKELEPYARVREESTRLYDKRRRELGLPSLEETRRRNLIEAQAIEEELRESEKIRSEEENYWRARASELRSELAAVDAEIIYVRTRIEETPVAPASSFTIVNSAFPIGVGRSFGRGGTRDFSNVHAGRVFASPVGVTPSTARVGFSGATIRGRVGFNNDLRRNIGRPIGGGFSGAFVNSAFGVRFDSRFRRREFAIAPPFLPFGSVTSFSSPYFNYDYGYAREVLVVRLDELIGRRAALRARWRDLEEEARRAGAMPGWLRP